MLLLAFCVCDKGRCKEEEEEKGGRDGGREVEGMGWGPRDPVAF